MNTFRSFLYLSKINLVISRQSRYNDDICTVLTSICLQGGEKLKINVLSEPHYRSTAWFRQTMDAIIKKAAALRYEVAETDTEKLIFSEERLMAIVIGTSNSWVTDTLRSLMLKNVHAIVVSCQPEELFDNTSYVLIDHARAMNDMISLMRSVGRDRIALYGINSDSHSDRIKIRYLLDAGYPNSSIYCINGGSLVSCYNNFQKNITEYNAVICANDIAAVALVNHMISDGYKIPEEYFIIGFGNSLTGQMCKIPLTTISLDHEELGVQSVLLYSYLSKNTDNVTITVKVPCSLTVRKSAEFNPVSRKPDTIFAADSSFYKDDELNGIMRIEKTLQACDKTDLNIIHGILNYQAYCTIAENAFISENSVKYRIKRLLSISGFDRRDKFREMFLKYISNDPE